MKTALHTKYKKVKIYNIGVIYIDTFIDDILAWDDITNFEKAYAIANDVHKSQLRDEGTPYITHIDGVINILKNELKIRSDMVFSVAALHDTLEDSDKYSHSDYVKFFGQDIADAVQLLTKIDGQSVEEYLKRIDESPYSSWLMLIKLADRLNNCRCLKYIMNKEKILKKTKETENYYLSYAEKYNPYLLAEIKKALNEL